MMSVAGDLSAERQLLERLSGIVKDERSIEPLLKDFRFDTVTTGGVTEFSDQDVNGYHALVDAHAALVEKWQSSHMRPDLDNLKEITQKFLADYGVTLGVTGGENLPRPSNVVIKTLLCLQRSVSTRTSLLTETAAELSEDVSTTTQSGDIPLIHTADELRESSRRTIQQANDDLWEREPGKSAMRLFECMKKVCSIAADLKNLHSDRWWNSADQLRSADLT